MDCNQNDVTPIRCVDCSTHLPLRVSQGPGAVRVRCRFCGSIYRGLLLADSDSAPLGNVEIIDDADFFGPRFE